MKFHVFDHRPSDDEAWEEAVEATTHQRAAIEWAMGHDEDEHIARGSLIVDVYVVHDGDKAKDAMAFKVSGTMTITYAARMTR